MRSIRILTVTVLLVMSLGVVPATAQDAADAAPAIEPAVAEIGVGTGFDRETRSLVGEATVFPAGTATIYCRTRITGAVEPTTVTHVWYHEGRTLARVELAVGSSDWRTYSSKRLLATWTGRWEVKVLDAAGTVLDGVSFTVE